MNTKNVSIHSKNSLTNLCTKPTLISLPHWFIENVLSKKEEIKDFEH